MSKSRDAFRTISEVSEALDTPAHVLRFWESKFTQVKPVKRAGGRRYYRPGDMDLLAGIKKLLHDDGMTIKGAQKLLREQGVKHVAALGAAALDAPAEDPVEIDVTPADPAEPKAVNQEPAEAAPQASEPEPVDTAPEQPAPEATNVVSLTPSEPEPTPAPVPTPAPAPIPAPAEEVAAKVEEPAQEALPVEEAPTEEAAPVADSGPAIAAIEVPSDPADNSSKLPARFFDLLHKAPHDRLAAKAEAIAPLLDRMQLLRDRISTR